MNRRNFLKKTAQLTVGACLYPIHYNFASPAAEKLKYLILGIDGMDFHLTHKYLTRGLLPNFKKLALHGSFRPMGSTFPPQSPVAWSSFAVGAPPSAHGIYDFIHRNPKSLIPYLSTSKVMPTEKTLSLGKYEIPLVGGKVKNLRKGKPFWEYLADHDIPTTIFKMPGNFPCESEKVNMVSGMGTPDLRGGYGSFTLFTTSTKGIRENITGGMVVPIDFKNDLAETSLQGPENTLKKGHPKTQVPVKIWRDKKNSVVKLTLQDNEFLLKKGEWTDWFQLSFEMIPHISDVKGICKVFIKSVHPEFIMYVSPINIDPSDPVLPIVSSEKYGKTLSSEAGMFYTQGLPEDTKALSQDILSNQEYLDLAFQIIDERKKLLDHELKRFAKQDNGLLFFYFSSLDQDTHMFWRAQDPLHPLYNKELGEKYGNVLKKIYIEMDQSLGKVLDTLDINDPNIRLVVMSDHGFAPFRRQVNLNTWLHSRGYLELDCPIESTGEFFSDVNWRKTAAYALGINAIYLNIENRENFGTLSTSQARQALLKIRKDLLNLKDPKTGKQIVSNIYTVPDTEKISNPHAPDLIVGWNVGYRTSWGSILGGFSKEVIQDNDDKWSGDHCIDPALVPAVIFSNRNINRSNLNICDITATVLSEFGISVPADYTGLPFV